jgi:hypothetical protein
VPAEGDSVKVKRSTLKRRCDRLWSLIIRASNRGTCKLAGRDNVRCGGVLQAAHCFGRGYSGVRYELWNGWPLCAGHHVYYTHKPELWIWRLEDEWGEAAYSERFALATAAPKRADYGRIEAELLEAAKLAEVA